MLAARQRLGHLSRVAVVSSTNPSLVPLGNFEPRRHYSGDPGPSTVRLNRPKYVSRAFRPEEGPKPGRAAPRPTGGSTGPRAPRERSWSNRKIPVVTGRPAVRASRDPGRPPVRASRDPPRSGRDKRPPAPRYAGSSKSHERGEERIVDARGRPVRNRPAGPNLGENPSSYATARVFREFLEAHPSPMSEQDLNEAVKIVIFAPRHAQNAVVFNMMLAMIGREKKMERMYKAFIDMKKRGITPTSRTFVTLLNAYAGIPHSASPAEFVPSKRPESKTMNRILAIYKESQEHLIEMITKVNEQNKFKAAKNDIGLASPASERLEVDEEKTEDVSVEQEEITLAPTNSYLKLLARYGMWKEMDQVHAAMDSTGPLAPDNITYSTLLASVLNRHALQFMSKPQPRNPDPGHPNPLRATELIEPFDIGPAARLLWDQAVRQFHGPSPPKDAGGNRYIDEQLAVLAIQAFMKARPADQRLSVSLIPFLWNLESPTSGVKVASMNAPKPQTSASSPPTVRPTEGIPEFMHNIPPLNLTLPAASTIISVLLRSTHTTLASGYAKLFLATPEIRNNADFAFLNTCIHALSNTGDIDAILDILNSFQPPNGKEGWAMHVWTNALTACRWAGDWPAAVDIWRRMTHVRKGVETGEDSGEYKWTSPNGRPTDVRGKRWIKPEPCRPDSKALSLLLKTALSTRTLPEIRQSYRLLSMYNLDTMLTIPSTEIRQPETKDPIRMLASDEVPLPPPSPGLQRALEWRLQLTRDVQAVVERLIEGNKNEKEVSVMREISSEMERVLKRFGFRENNRSKPLLKRALHSRKVTSPRKVADDEERLVEGQSGETDQEGDRGTRSRRSLSRPMLHETPSA